MSRVRALVVGSLVHDLAFRVPSRPEPGEVIFATAFGSFRGGKGYNQAVALARLGAEVTMVGAVGRDAYGDGFVTALTDEGVDTTRVRRLDDVATSVAVPLITPDGDVGFVQHPGANRSVRPEHVGDLPDADVLLLQGELPEATSLAAARTAVDRGCRVVLNPAPVHAISTELLASAQVVIPNEVEASALMGTGSLPAGDGADVAAAEALRGGDRAAVVTLGARGAAWANASGSGLVVPPTVDPVDATAAGDSFCAALAFAIASGRILPEAVAFACAAGAYATTVSGAEPGLPTLAQVEALLAT